MEQSQECEGGGDEGGHERVRERAGGEGGQDAGDVEEHEELGGGALGWVGQVRSRVRCLRVVGVSRNLMILLTWLTRSGRYSESGERSGRGADEQRRESRPAGANSLARDTFVRRL